MLLDASVLVPALVPQRSTSAVERFFRAGNEDAFVDDFAAAEVCSALSRLVRTGSLSRNDGAVRLAVFDVMRTTMWLPQGVVPADVRRAEQIVRRFDLMLKTPDALHAAIAERLGARLVTLDQRLAVAARALGIEVDVPA